MIEIIPAIDIIDGKCVRLSQGDYARRSVYHDDPLDVAKSFAEAGIRRLHVVDLDGAKAQHIVNHKALERIASHSGLSVDFGGGLKTDDDLRIAFECGADMVTGGSIAVKNPELFTSWLEKYGAGKIILGADVVDERIAVSGWTETTSLGLFPFIATYKEKGISSVICTDISRDGMLQGPAIDLYKKILSEQAELYLIASGGVASIQDILELEAASVPAVIVGKAFYEGRIKLSELKIFV